MREMFFIFYSVATSTLSQLGREKFLELFNFSGVESYCQMGECVDKIIFMSFP